VGWFGAPALFDSFPTPNSRLTSSNPIKLV
jgi:hypothetical protein